jgi:hypothetical protein
MPSGLTEAGRRVLMLQVSRTQKVDRKILPYLMISKLERLISEAEDENQDVEALLEEVPDLALAAQYETTPRQMAEAVIEADSLSLLISRAELSSSPKPLDVQAQYQEQTLASLIEDLLHEIDSHG